MPSRRPLLVLLIAVVIAIGALCLRPAATDHDVAPRSEPSPTAAIDAADRGATAPGMGDPVPARSEAAAAEEACAEFDAWAATIAVGDAPTSTATDDAQANLAVETARVEAPAVPAAGGADARDAIGSPAIARGATLATRRRAAMKRLIQLDPAAALAHVVPYRTRRALPDAIRSQLEEPISARGDLLVAVALPVGDQPTTVTRTTVIGDRRYDAYVYGWRTRQISQHGIPLQGVALDGAMAVDTSSVRLLSREEIADVGAPAATACPVSGAPAAAGVVAEVAGELHPLCSAGHITQLESSIRAAQGAQADGTVSQAPPTAWTTGPKTVLVMRVDCDDNPGEPVSVAYASQIMAECDTFFRANSYGATSLTTTVTSVLRMPRTAEWYRQNGVGQVLYDAQQASAAAGYDPYHFSFLVVAYTNLGGPAGQGYVGGSGTWATEFTFRVLAHELGHNYGLWHANAWVPSDGTPDGGGHHAEYGEPFDTMGGWGSQENHFNAYEKNLLGWLGDQRVQDISASGVYHIAPHDVAGGGVAAVRVREGNGKDYWFSTRGLQRRGGVFVHRFYFGIEGAGSELLDLTPTSGGGMDDAAMAPGFAFSVASPTPMTARTLQMYDDGSADLLVDLGGAPPNQPPVARLSANATSGIAPLTVAFDASASSDPDGRIANYAWSFGDGATLNEGGPYPNHAYASGSYIATVTVSDERGATASATIAITVRDPTPPGDGTGLLAQYWSDHGDFSGSPTLTRVDETLDFDWGGGSPAESVSADGFTARWSGQVQAPTSGTYTFTTTSDDGVRLWVAGQLVVDAWYPQGPTDHSGSIAMTAGQKVDIAYEYFEAGGGAVARLAWEGPGVPRAIVPRTALYPAGTGGGDGTGLLASYWSQDIGLNGAPTFTRTDATVDFDWGGGSPDQAISSDWFSARWSGQVQAPTSEEYTFTVTGDDGVRLWIDGVLVIDAWYPQSATDHSARVALKAGVKAAIRLEYYEQGGDAVARLSWSTPGRSPVIVPRTALYPEAAPASEASIVPPSGNG